MNKSNYEHSEKFKLEQGKYLDKDKKLKCDIDILNKGIIENIEFEKEINQEELKGVKAKNAIAFISTANIDNFDLYAIEKTMIVFNEVEKALILCTKESKYKAEELKEKLEKQKLEINIEETGIDDYDEIYDNLEIWMDKYNFERLETILDTTQGPRMLGGVFYKFAVEQGIKLISWQAKQKENIRIPGTDKFNFIKYPQLKNYRLYQNANKLVEQYKFKEAAMLYEQINNNDMALALKAMGNIFSEEAFESYESWQESIDSNIKLLKSIKDKEVKRKVEKYIWFFSQILMPFSGEQINEDSILIFEEFEWNNLNRYFLKKTINKEKKCFENIYWFEEEDKKKIYSIFNLIYIKNIYSTSVALTILYDSNNPLAGYLLKEELIEDFLEGDYLLEDILNDAGYRGKFINEIFLYIYSETNNKALFNPISDFKIDLEKFALRLENGIIKNCRKVKGNINLIEKIGVNNNRSKNHRVLYSLFEQKNYEIEKENFLGVLLKIENIEIEKEKVKEKRISRIKKNINEKYEEKIKEILEKRIEKELKEGKKVNDSDKKKWKKEIKEDFKEEKEKKLKREINEEFEEPLLNINKFISDFNKFINEINIFIEKKYKISDFFIFDEVKKGEVKAKYKKRLQVNKEYL